MRQAMCAPQCSGALTYSYMVLSIHPLIPQHRDGGEDERQVGKRANLQYPFVVDLHGIEVRGAKANTHPAPAPTNERLSQTTAR